MGRELKLRIEVEVEGVLTDLDGALEEPRVLPTVTRVAVYTSDVGGRRSTRVACDEGEERAFASVSYDDAITGVVVTRGGSSPQWANSGLPEKVRRRVNNLGCLAVQAFDAVHETLEVHEAEDLT